MMTLNNFKLLKEDGDSYQVAHPNGKKLKVSKKGLSDKAHQAIQKLKVQHFEDGGIPVGLAADPTPEQDQALAVEQGQPQVPVAQVPMAMAQPQMAQPQGAQPQPQAMARPQMDPLSQNKVDMNGLLDNQENAAKDLMKSQEQAAQQTQSAYQNYINQTSKIKTPDQVAQSYKEKDEALLKAYTDSKVDPNNYVHNMGTGSKILAGISIFLGGFGTKDGRPNYALETLHKAIDQDIQAQKDSQGKALNLYKINHEQMHDETAANLATQNQMWTGVQAKVAMATSNTNSAIAKARGSELINQIEQQKAQNRMRLGLLQGANGVSQTDPLNLVNEMVPADQRKEAIHELGQAQSATKMEGGLKQLFDQAAQDARPMTGRSSTALLNAVPGYHPQSVNNLVALFDPLIHDNEGRINELEQQHVKALIPAFGDSDERVKEKWNALREFVQQKKQSPTFKAATGLDINNFSSTTDNPVDRLGPKERGYYNWAKANPSSPVSQAFLKKHGFSNE